MYIPFIYFSLIPWIPKRQGPSASGVNTAVTVSRLPAVSAVGPITGIARASACGDGPAITSNISLYRLLPERPSISIL